STAAPVQCVVRQCTTLVSFNSSGSFLSDPLPNRTLEFKDAANSTHYHFHVKAAPNQSSKLYQTQDRRNQRLSGPQFLPLPNAAHQRARTESQVQRPS